MQQRKDHAFKLALPLYLGIFPLFVEMWKLFKPLMLDEDEEDLVKMLNTTIDYNKSKGSRKDTILENNTK